MTSYHGGKQRIGRTIAQIIAEEVDEFDFNVKGYCEPFVGMCGVYQYIPDLFSSHIPKFKYKAGDINKSVIMMWNAAKRGWKPPNKKITKKEFMSLKVDGKSSAKKGFVGHVFGYMGKYFQPFDNRKSVKSIQKTSDNVSRIAKELKSVIFKSGGYTQYSNLKNFVIYCDPPYQIQAHYYKEEGTRRSFDHEEFWDWCRDMAMNNIVFVSEYKAPRDFICLWKSDKNKEKLFVLY